MNKFFHYTPIWHTFKGIILIKNYVLKPKELSKFIFSLSAKNFEEIWKEMEQNLTESEQIGFSNYS